MMTEWNAAAFDAWLGREEEEPRFAVIREEWVMIGSEPERERVPRDAGARVMEEGAYHTFPAARHALELLQAHGRPLARYRIIDRENLGQEVEG